LGVITRPATSTLRTSIGFCRSVIHADYDGSSFSGRCGGSYAYGKTHSLQ